MPVQLIHAALWEIIEKERKIAPMAFAVQLEIASMSLTYTDLLAVQLAYKQEEHRIEELTKTHVKLILL